MLAIMPMALATTVSATDYQVEKVRHAGPFNVAQPLVLDSIDNNQTVDWDFAGYSELNEVIGSKKFSDIPVSLRKVTKIDSPVFDGVIEGPTDITFTFDDTWEGVVDYTF